MARVTVWPGDNAALAELKAAIQHNCACVPPIMYANAAVCEPHRMLTNQESLNRLAFVYSIRERLQREESEA